MRHQKLHTRLQRPTAHRQSLLRNMATSLFRYERIETTSAKARALRPFAERLLTLGKRGDLHARRLAARHIQDHEVLQKLFGDLAERLRTRPGGYLRILKVGLRRGDAAPTSLIEFVDKAVVVPPETAAKAGKSTKATKPAKETKETAAEGGEPSPAAAPAKRTRAVKSAKPAEGAKAKSTKAKSTKAAKSSKAAKGSAAEGK